MPKHNVRNERGVLTAIPVETVLGPMTVVSIAAFAGVNVNTIRSRIYAGVTGSDLFRPTNVSQSRNMRRADRSRHTAARYTERWADRKRSAASL
jgi:hypothetical protein